MRLSVWAAAMPVIGVDDLARTTRFYTHGLGFALVRGAATPVDGTPAYAFLRHGAVELMVYELEPGGGRLPDRRGRGRMLLYVAVSDVESLSAELRIRRIRVTPVAAAGAGRYCEVEDPDGFVLRFGTVTDPLLRALGNATFEGR